MSASGNMKSGGEILVECLHQNDVDLVFGVPGESYLAVLDALVDKPDMRFINARHEGGATMMADAYGKLTGKPGIAMVTRGPGATNGSSGIHVAFQDSTPMIVLIGQIGRDMVEREAFQEIDYRRMFGQMAKWVAQIDDPARIPEFMNRAFSTALSGRPGPVVLALPEDMLTEPAVHAEITKCEPLLTHPGDPEMAKLRTMLFDAERPFAIVGGGGWSEETCADFMKFAEAQHLPVGASFRCQDYFDNTHPNYAGHVGIGIDPALAAQIKSADLLIVVGSRLGEMTTSGYSLIDIPRPAQKIVHVYPDASEINRVYDADLGIISSMGPFAKRAAQMAKADTAKWTDTPKAAHSAYEAFATPKEQPGDVNLGEIVTWLGDRLGPEAIMCNGAGNYTVWVHRFHKYQKYRSCLAPTSGSMGYGPPAGVAAKLVHPDRPVVVFAGDGCFLMACQELTTAVQYDLPILYVVVNNGMYGTIRMHQEREYPTRRKGTDLINPDFAKFAESCGAFGAVVTRTEDFADTCEAALASGKPALIEVQIDPESLTPAASLSQIRQKAIDAGKGPAGT